MATCVVLGALLLITIIAMMLLLSLDVPVPGTEPRFNPLQVAQASVTGAACWGFLSRSRRVHTAISMLVFLALGAVVIIRFFPGGGNR